MKRWIAVIAVSVAALGTVGTGVASAKVSASSVKIASYTFGFFNPQVKSKAPGCKQNRRVEIWKHTMSGDQMINFGKTDNFGRASINDLDGLGGTYFPVARKKSGKYKGTGYKCLTVTGPDFTR